jgi:hypothetical protein
LQRRRPLYQKKNAKICLAREDKREAYLRYTKLREKQESGVRRAVG